MCEQHLTKFTLNEVHWDWCQCWNWFFGRQKQFCDNLSDKISRNRVSAQSLTFEGDVEKVRQKALKFENTFLRVNLLTKASSSHS